MKKNQFLFDLKFFQKSMNHYIIILFLFVLHCLGDWTCTWSKIYFYLTCGISITLSMSSYIINLNFLNKLFNILTIFVIVEITISLLESFSSFRRPISSYSSISSLFGKDPMQSYLNENLFFQSKFRPPTGFRRNTNDLAICMIITLPFFLCSKKNIAKVFGTVAITLIVVMTASRVVFLSLIYTLYLFIIKKNCHLILSGFLLFLADRYVSIEKAKTPELMS